MPTRALNSLRPHPDNARIYGDRADPELVESIRARGVLNPLLIAHDGRIISGHRRWDAARRASLPDVPVVFFGSTDELDILEAVIESNRQRAKDNMQIGREAATLMDIAHERAKRRQGERTDLNGKTTNLPENFPESQRGEARDAVGAALGISGKTAEKAATVAKVIDELKADGKAREAEQLAAALNKSVSAGFQKAKEAGYVATAPKPEPKRSTEPVLIHQWRAMNDEERQAVLARPRSRSAKFNAQEENSIEWALWSWNPVTGCLHDCAYCYARDIAERFYPQRFVPAFLPERLDAPKNTRVPSEAATSIGHRNVFTCSMADLFGRWVPGEWIDAVLGSCAANPQWNFLFLTKFPNRLAEFEFPDNAWVGTSVDAQARVANAERSMARVRAKVRWLSCEPLLEPLRFSDLSVVDWVVIGGASRSTETPEFRPPRSWVEDLERQARSAGCRVYEKANLLERIRDYPGGEDVAGVDVPTAFKMRYLQRDVIDPESYRQETDVEG